jgi:adenylate kinase family enzyme
MIEAEEEMEPPKTVKIAEERIAGVLLYYIEDIDADFNYTQWNDKQKGRFDKAKESLSAKIEMLTADKAPIIEHSKEPKGFTLLFEVREDVKTMEEYL